MKFHSFFFLVVLSDVLKAVSKVVSFPFLRVSNLLFLIVQTRLLEGNFEALCEVSLKVRKGTYSIFGAKSFNDRSGGRVRK